MSEKKVTALTIERAKYKPAFTASGKPKGNRISIGRGLYCHVTPNGIKSYRFDYRLNGRKVLVYGQHGDEISFAEANELHTDARRLIAAGLVPTVVHKKVISKKDAPNVGVDNRFKAVGEEWYAACLRTGNRKTGKPYSHAWKSNTRRWLDQAYDAFGNKLLPDVDAPDVLSIIKKVESNGYAASAEYLRQTISYVFRYGILHLRAPRGFNPAEAVRGAVMVPAKKHHRKLERQAIAPFIAAVQASDEPEDIKIGLMLLLHCFPRRTELTLTPWTEIQEDRWSIAEDRTKKDRPHTIPLTAQTRAMFDRLKQLADNSPYVFPSPRKPNKPRGKEAFNHALHRLGFKGIFSPHGARSTAVSFLAESGFAKEIVKAQLSHAEENSTDGAYWQTTFFDRRREMLSFWSRYLETLAAGGADVIPISEKAAA